MGTILIFLSAYAIGAITTVTLLLYKADMTVGEFIEALGL